MKQKTPVQIKSSDNILDELKEIITNNNVVKNESENIKFNIKKITNDDNKFNIKNILNDLSNSYNNPIKDNSEKKDIHINNNQSKYLNINFYNKKYLIKIHNIISSNLNIYNLNKVKILKENIIQNDKESILLETKNSSYLLDYFNNTYLLNKVDNKLLITFLKNKKTIILNDNSFFKLSNYNFYVTFKCTLLVPIINKKIFNNKNGQQINYFEPNI